MSIFRKKQEKSDFDLELENKLNQLAKELYEKNKDFKSCLFNVENDYTTLYLVGVPRHGNMGDHAMQTGIYSFLKKSCP